MSSDAALETATKIVPCDDFDRWVEPYLRHMSHLAARLVGGTERDDVVQDALTRAWQRWATYDPARGSPLPWLLAIVVDQARRTRRRLHRRPVSGTWQAPTGAVAVEVDLDLERAIACLAPRQRLAVELFYFVDLDVASAAQVMGCSTGTVKSTLSDARERLRAALEGS